MMLKLNSKIYKAYKPKAILLKIFNLPFKSTVMINLKFPKYKNFTISKYLDRAIFVVGIIISSVAFACIVLRIIFKTINIDDLTLYFFIFGVIPWSVLFIQKFKGLGIEFEGGIGKVGAVDNPPAVKAAPPQGDQLSQEAIKVIATLWKYQTQSFGTDFTKRWTFLIYPQSPGYANYIKGVAGLLDKQLVQIQQDGQILLSDMGIEFIREHHEVQNFQFTYNF